MPRPRLSGRSAPLPVVDYALREATINAGYQARMAILNGADWEDYITPEGINESHYLTGWNLAEIHHAQAQTPLQALLDEQELSRAHRREYPAIQARHRARDRQIAEIETAAQIATAAEESAFALS